MGVFRLSRSLKMVLLAQSKNYLQTKHRSQKTYRFSNETIHCYCEKLTNILNDCLKENGIPILIKVVKICPSFKKLDNTPKDNYRPINTLCNFAKPFESIIYSQLNDCMKSKLSEYHTGFRKNHDTQNSLLRTIESWKAKLNNGSEVIIINLSKAFDSLNHDLLFAKLEAYGLDINTVSFTRNYLTNRLQLCKINNFFSEQVICWAPTRTYIRTTTFQYFHILSSYFFKIVT